MSFLEIQTQTGWGRVLQGFAGWCQPQAGWLPALFAGYGCQAFGVDLDAATLAQTLHPTLVQAQAVDLPFPQGTFHLLTTSNLLFFLPDPEQALREMRRLVRADGWVALLNPSERMSVAAAAALADQRGLAGLDRVSLLDWAMRAEAHQRWDEAETAALFAAAGMFLHETILKLGPGLARFARGRRN